MSREPIPWPNVQPLTLLAVGPPCLRLTHEILVLSTCPPLGEPCHRVRLAFNTSMDVLGPMSSAAQLHPDRPAGAEVSLPCGDMKGCTMFQSGVNRWGRLAIARTPLQGG